MRRILDTAYFLGGAAAGALIVGICLLISGQIVLNVLSRLLGDAVPSSIPSYADFAGFMLAGASFLALAHTLRAGGHIRVNLLVARLPSKAQRWAEIAVIGAATALVAFALWFMGALVIESVRYGDVSPGIVPVPLWAPQTVVCAGLALLLVALIDTGVEAWRGDGPVLTTPEEI